MQILRSLSSYSFATSIAALLVFSLGGTPAASAKPSGGGKEKGVKEKEIDPKSIKCPSESSTVYIPERDIKLTCKDGFSDCESDIPLFAKNCTSNFIEVTKLEMYEHDRPSMILDFSPASIVPPGGAWREKIPWTTPGEVRAVVHFRPPGGGTTDTAGGPVKVVNAGRDAAMAACEKCQGTWGKYGINAKEGCNCKTKDAGKTCQDGNQCQGLCLFDGYDGSGREQGHCSEKERVSGCMNIVQKGQLKLPVKVPPPRKLPICID
mgnify:CR=1 FL=1